MGLLVRLLSMKPSRVLVQPRFSASPRGQPEVADGWLWRLWVRAAEPLPLPLRLLGIATIAPRRPHPTVLRIGRHVLS